MVTGSSQGTKVKEVKIHVVTKVKDIWDCPACDTTVKTRSELTNHIRDSHADPNYGNQCATSLVCQGCTSTKQYATRAGLIAHIKATHPQMSTKFDTLMKCRFCNEFFDKPINLAQHATVHTGYKKYTCKDCRFLTNHKVALQRHVRRYHSNELPWQCDTCGVQFEMESKLNQHVREKHSTDPKTGEKRTGSRADPTDPSPSKKRTGSMADSAAPPTDEN